MGTVEEEPITPTTRNASFANTPDKSPVVVGPLYTITV